MFLSQGGAVVISTFACLVVAGVSMTWAWRGPLPTTAREQKSSAEASEGRTNASGGAPAAPPGGNSAVPTTAAKTAPPPSQGAPAPAPAPAPAAASPTPTARSAEAAVGPGDAVLPPTGTRPTSPTELGRGPSLYETGRIGNAAVSEPGVPTNRGAERGTPREMAVQAKQPDRHDGATPATYAGVVDQKVLDREIAPRFRLLGDCKAEVAHRKRVATSTITGSRLVLRWTILPDGRVTDTQVVATSPADPRLVDCIKERMSGWSFRPGKGGSARVERKFSFP